MQIAPPPLVPRVPRHPAFADAGCSEKKRMASLLGCVLSQITAANPGNDDPALASFTSTSEVPVSAGDYLLRLSSLIDDDATLCLAVYYLRTLSTLHPCLWVTYLNVHRLLLAGLLCAVKVHEDRHYRNTQYAKIGGVQLTEMNLLEVEFLGLLDFNLHVTGAQYQDFLQELTQTDLHRHCACSYRVVQPRAFYTMPTTFARRRPLSRSSCSSLSPLSPLFASPTSYASTQSSPHPADPWSGASTPLFHTPLSARP